MERRGEASKAEEQLVLVQRRGLLLSLLLLFAPHLDQAARHGEVKVWKFADRLATTHQVAECVFHARTLWKVLTQSGTVASLNCRIAV